MGALLRLGDCVVVAVNVGYVSVCSVSWIVYFSASLTLCRCWNFVFRHQSTKRRLTMTPVVWKATCLSVS